MSGLKSNFNTWISDVVVRSDEDGVELQVTIRRDWRQPIGITPRKEDFPEDMLETLRKWVDQ